MVENSAIKTSLLRTDMFNKLKYLNKILIQRLKFFSRESRKRSYIIKKIGALLVSIQIQICLEKSSPLSGFEPMTSVVPSLCATDRAIQAWTPRQKNSTGVEVEGGGGSTVGYFRKCSAKIDF